MRLFYLFCIISVALSLDYSSSAQAKKPSFYGQSVGISHDFLKQDLTIYIDTKKLINNKSRLQKLRLIDSNLSNAEVGFYETQLSALVSIDYATNMLRHLYASNVQQDLIQVTSYLLTTDLYGNKAKSFCYSFNFNRQLYEKINWNHFQANNIIKIVPDFKTSDLCKALEEENPLSI